MLTPSEAPGALVENECFVRPTHVHVGQRVIVPYLHEGVWTGLRATVAECSSGGWARVVHHRYGVDQLFYLDDLRIEVAHPDPLVQA